MSCVVFSVSVIMSVDTSIALLCIALLCFTICSALFLTIKFQFVTVTDSSSFLYNNIPPHISRHHLTHHFASPILPFHLSISPDISSHFICLRNLEFSTRLTTLNWAKVRSHPDLHCPVLSCILLHFTELIFELFDTWRPCVCGMMDNRED